MAQSKTEYVLFLILGFHYQPCQNVPAAVTFSVYVQLIAACSTLEFPTSLRTLFRPGFFRPSGTGEGLQKPSLCNFKTTYAMATKCAQDSVRANSAGTVMSL